jgi:uncharacterized protein YggE
VRNTVTVTVTVPGVALFALALCLFGAGQAVWASDDNPAPRILVTGEGSVDVAPDMAVLVLSVMREAASAREALTANSAAMTKVLTAMTGLGIAKRDLQTASFDIQPRYTYPPRQSNGAEQAPRLVGYTVRNSLTVKVRDIAKIGEVLDASVTLGVNEGGSILFTNDDPSAAITQARVEAMQEAMTKARTLAEAAGVRIGKVLEILEQSYNPRPMAMAKMEMVAMDSRADAAPPIAAGENSYKVTVNVSLALEQ